MKQFPCVIITACSLLVSVISHAQIQKGQKMLGGNFSFLSTKEELEDADNKFTTSTFNFTPQLGFGLSNNWIFGLQAGYTSRKETQEDEPENIDYTESKFSIGAFVRKFKPLNEHFGIFGQGTLEVGFGKVKSEEDFEGEDKINELNVHVRPGLYWFASKRIILESTFGQLGYRSTKATNTEDDDYEFRTSEFGLSFTDGLSFGIKFIL